MAAVELGPLAALSVDVEEWYHNCWAPEYVDPARRGRLVVELDDLLPELLARFDRLGIRATFFVLGEVARRRGSLVREIDRAGHEIACHGDLHLRADDRSLAAFRLDVDRAKKLLEDLTGREVIGFRAPEWSLRRLANPRLRAVADLGFRYDSSLAPWLGAGDGGNPTTTSLLTWPDGATLVEFPPLAWGGPLRLPASGWCGRVAGGAVLRRAAAGAALGRRLALFAVHPWELVERPCPGLHTGIARFLHEAGRERFAARFDRWAGEVGFPRTLAERYAEIGSSRDDGARGAADRVGPGGKAVEGRDSEVSLEPGTVARSSAAR